MDTLVLNSGFQPINRISWSEAIGCLFSRECEVVEVYEEKFVHSGRNVGDDIPDSLSLLRTEEDGKWFVPSVIRFLTKAAGMFRKGVKFNRNNVWARDKGRCQFCDQRVSRSGFTYDHVIPRCQGGRTRWENIVVSCNPCNQQKRNRTPAQAKMKLRRTPQRPKYLPGVTSPLLNWREGMPETWRSYLASYRYWHSELDED